MYIENRTIEAWCRAVFWLFVVVGALGGFICLIRMVV